jgi:hypothetical protein
MFVGSIDSPLRQWMGTNARFFAGRTLFCGCSGNFTLENVCREHAKESDIYSNDIGIYTHVIGESLMGRRAAAEIQAEEYDWLRPYWDRDQAAAMIVLFEALKFEKQKNFFERRFWRAWMSRFGEKFELASARVSEVRERLRLTSFTSVDIGVFLERARKIDPRGVMVSFLPTYTAGYEKMYARLHEILAWKPPPYVMIDELRKKELFHEITANWDYILYDDQPHEGLPGVMLRDKGGSKRVWLYSNLDVKSSVIGLPTNIEPTSYARLTDPDIERIGPGSRVSFVQVKQPQFDYYRTLWLSKAINQSPCDLPFFVFIDGMLAGFIGIARSKYGDRSAGEVFLMTDFCVPATEGVRLSKLILLLTRTRELADAVAEKFIANVRVIATAVFTEKPVSMKYRGVYQLHSRSMNDEGKQVLLYRAQAGSFTIAEAIAKWLSSKERSEAPSNN